VLAAIALLLTGAINTLLLVGSVSALLGTPYGRLLAFKIMLFAAMVVASINRFRLAPRISDNPSALRPWATPSPSSNVWGSRCLQSSASSALGHPPSTAIEIAAAVNRRSPESDSALVLVDSRSTAWPVRIRHETEDKR
jgi:hypothetical protein